LARKGSAPNGRDRLEEALATLIQNQAAFVSQLSESGRRHAEIERQHLEFERRHVEYQRESAERFARIEAQIAEIIRVLAEHGRLLAEHSRLLERLPDAVRDKIGFKAQP
jgi:predicted  nucleic acid-binding Zn-ribbon protein